MPNDAFLHYLRDFADQIDELIKACRKHLDESFDAMCEVKAALEKERTLFTSLIKQRFSRTDRERIVEIAMRVRQEMKDSREQSKHRMQKYGMEPDKDA